MSPKKRQGTGKTPSRGFRTHVVIDYKVLGISLLLVALLGGAGYWRYRQQTRINSVVLLENARKLEESGQWKEAARLYLEYLRLNRDLTAEKTVHRDFALAYLKGAETYPQKARATQLLFFALGLNPDEESQQAMRLPLANLLADLNQYDRVIEVLKDAPESSPRVRQLRTFAKYNASRSGDDVTRGEAFRELADAFLEQPEDVKIAELIGDDAKLLSRRLSSDEYKELASRCMAQLVSFSANRKIAAAWLASYRFNRDVDQDLARRDLERAVDYAVTAEEKVTVSQVVMASISPGEDPKITEQQLTRLEGILRPVVGKGGLKTADAYLTLGGVLSMLNKQDEAVQLWEDGLAAVESADVKEVGSSAASTAYLAFQLANAKLALGDQEASRKYLQQATKASDEMLKFAGSSDSFRLELEQFRDRRQLLNFRLAIAEGNLNDTISQLVQMVKTRPEVAGSGPARDFAYELHSLLGSAYEKTSQWELAAESYEAASQYASQPSDVSAQLASRCWMQAGNESKAFGTILDSMRNAATEDTRAVGPLLQLAELALKQQMSIPEKDRNWTEFEQALETAEQREPNAWQVPVLRAVRLIDGKGTKEPAQVTSFLSRAETTAPDSLEMWFQVASVYQRLDDVAGRDRAVEAYERLEERQWARTFMRARLAASDNKFIEAAKMAATLIPSLPEEDKPGVWRQVAFWYDQAGDLEMARQTLIDAHAKLPEQIELTRMLADAYLADAMWKELEQIEGDLKVTEGDEGVLWRLYRCYRLIRDNRGDAASRHAEAGKLLNHLSTKLPSWPTPYALKGEMLQSAGLEQDALEQFEMAVRLGDRRVETFESLVRILVGLGEFEKANRYTGMLQARLSSSPMLVGLAAESLRKSGNLASEIVRVREIIKAQPNDVSKRLWLAKLLEMNKDSSEAEKEYRESVKAAPDDPSTWLGLFEFYVVRSPETAAKLIERMDRVMNSVPLERRTLLMSRCLSSVGRTEDAVQRLRDAAQSLPESTSLRMELGRLLMATSPEEAEKNLRELVNKDPEDNASKQMLAMVLATNGGAEGWKEAVSLLNGSKRDAVNQRLEAILLANRGQADEMARSREILQDLTRQSERFEATDHRLLAIINESLGDSEAAETEYKALVAQPGLNLDDLGRYVDFLLRRNATDEAAKVLKVLDEKSAKASIPGRLRYVERQARYWKEVDQAERVDSLLRDFTDRVVAEAGPEIENPRAAAYGTAGRLALSIEQFDQAEQWIRRLVEVLPSEKWQLAEVMAHQGRYEEGLELLMPAKSGDAIPDTETCIRLLNFLSIGEPPSEIWKRTEPIWQSWLKDADLRKQMAGVAAMVVGRKMDVATETLDKLIASHPNDPMVLNNAATVLGEIEQRREDGLKLVNRAIEQAGPLPFLLDTKSLILVEMGRQKEAVELLRHFINQPYADSRVLFRLAIAEYKSSNSKGALAAYERARSAGLGSQILSVQDRTHVRELELLRREAASNKTSRTSRSRPQAA